ncbi:hypothetical protein BJ546DRAFT_1064447 [Cryomyces antarcticus]
MPGFSPFNSPQTSISSPNFLTGTSTQNGDLSDTPSGALPTRLTTSSPTHGPVDTDGSSLAPCMSNVDSKEENSPWSSAVGRATIGKSGRVIERLMAENDRLRREIKSEIASREELQKTLSTSKPRVDSLTTENDNLVQMRTVDLGVLSRRERKIEELKADLKAERVRRELAETKATELGRQRDEVTATAKREVEEARDREQHAITHAQILESSHKQLSAEYRQRTETITKTIRTLTAEREDDRRKYQRLDIVVDQMRQELESTKRANSQMAELFKSYRSESDRTLDEMVQEVQERELSGRKMGEEMQHVVGQMRWLMNLKRNVKNVDEGISMVSSH